MSSSLDHKCQRCGSEYHGQICPFCTITGLDVNALLASEGLAMPPVGEGAADAPPPSDAAGPGEVVLIDVVSNRTFPINSPVCRFGRDISNDVVLTGDKSLSRFHFQVTIVNNEYFVEDAGSRNGSFLNGAPVTAPKKLLNGDIISAGMSRYRLVVGGEAQAVAENKAAEAAGLNDPPPGEPTSNDPKTLGDAAADPLKRIMEEGQALLGSPDSTTDAQAFLEPKNGDSAPKQLDMSSKETPVEELFQEKLRAAEAQKAAAPAQVVPPPPIPPVPTAPTPQPAPAQARTDWPQWCTNYHFPEIVEIKEKMETLEMEIRERQAQLGELGHTVATTEDIRNRMLATEGNELVHACSEILRLLGWETAMNGNSDNEVVLSYDSTAAAIAKIVSTNGQPRNQDLATLVSSLSTYWCDNGVEPKGLLIVSMMSDGLPEDRAEFSKEIVQYATKKNVCLMSTVQLLAMFRDATLRDADVESVRSDVLGASGALPGFEPVKSAS